MSQVPFERDYSLQVALSAIIDHFSVRGWSWDLDSIPLGQRYGLDVHAAARDAEATTSRGVSSEGHGKGVGLGSVCGAHYECFEHMICEHFPYPENDGRVHSGERLRGDVILDLAPASSSATNIEFRILGKSDAPNYLAAEYCNGDPTGEFDRGTERLIKAYYTSNGWAAGASVSEATLHALNELIERDSVSAPFIACGVGRSWGREYSLESDEMVLVREIEVECGFPVMVAAIPAATGYVTLAYCSSEAGVLRMGCGDSQDTTQSIERALRELWQEIRAEKNGTADEIALARRMGEVLKKYPGLARCLALDGQLESPPASRSPTGRSQHGSRAQQVSTIIADLQAIGITTYLRVAYSSTAGGCEVCVVQVVAPGMERFQVIRSGIPAEPIARLRSRRSVLMARDTVDDL